MRIIIIGSDGPIGKALQGHLRKFGHSVFGTTRRPDALGDGRIFLDLNAATLPALPPADVAIICAAMTKFADCRNFPDEARRVNVFAPATIAREIRKTGGRTLLLSSSVVFDCLSPHAKAETPPNPRSAYGRLKAEAEAAVLAQDGTVLRLTKVIMERAGILADWIEALAAGRTVRAFEDHTFCPVRLQDVLDAITAVIGQPGGIFQLSGADDISYADAARHIASRLGRDAGQVKSVGAVESGIPSDDVTACTSLDVSRLTALTGYRARPARSVIDEVYAAAFAAQRPQQKVCH
jgi:dTDP-4-dehydrorhamnose reductase